MNALLTRNELAAELKVSTKTVARMTDDGSIPYIRAGRQYRYDLEAVRAALTPAPKPVPAWEQSARSRARKRVA